MLRSVACLQIFFRRLGRYSGALNNHLQELCQVNRLCRYVGAIDE